ncbi:hypothetical protein H0E87_025454 [Populus deltoides]|uniref:Uncharacterized protein n=1 Tax=Populus deltoides TaxID=3696 RepID=A0A8T2WZP1_POPDE|nr:hypothetical protein H0E87_025454 [Populus deltoides]
MDLNPIKDAFDRVAKKQKMSGSKTQEVLAQMIREIENSLEIIKAEHFGSEVDCKSVFGELKKKLLDIAPLSQLEGTQKELNIALSKYPKQLEKSFNPDISKAYRNIDFDAHTVNQIIAGHFYRQGLFDVGDCFINEANVPESTAAMKSLFSEMYLILEAMKNKNLEPALNWATANSNMLKENGSDLLLKLHCLQFVEILQGGSRSKALSYVRTHISPFGANHFSEIQKLMACLLWSGRLHHSPYSDLLSPANWNVVAEELTRQFCNLLGQSFDSPLSVTIAAGFQGLPPLLKFMNVMAGKKHEWQSMKQLPVPVELDREFQFHSIFVCPVLKEQSTDENPPMLMQCGHVLCKQSINKMSKNGSKTFKCPYCPSDIDSTQYILWILLLAVGSHFHRLLFPNALVTRVNVLPATIKPAGLSRKQEIGISARKFRQMAPGFHPVFRCSYYLRCQYCVSDIQFQVSNIKTWISAAITDENTCTLGFDDRKISDEVMRKIKMNIVNVARLTSNA